MNSEMDDPHRNYVRSLARDHLARNDPAGWFEPLYAQAVAGKAQIPWNTFEPNPNLVSWLEREQVRGEGRRAIVVGCGVGDDAEALAGSGFRVTGFDVSPTAIEWCRRRFPDSSVNYAVADVLKLPPAWSRAFDFVLESYTVQALPPDVRERAIASVAEMMAAGGRALMIARARDEGEAVEGPPWPLTRRELESFEKAGLKQASFEDYLDDEHPPVRRFRVVYRHSD